MTRTSTKNNDKSKHNATVFLGGTCNGSTWRDELSKMLDDDVSTFNPVVDDWNEAAQSEEDWHKQNDGYCLYVITPEMIGFYSIFEVADDSNKRHGRVICCFLPEYGGKEFDSHSLRAIDKIKRDLARNGAIVCENLWHVARFLNTEVAARR